MVIRNMQEANAALLKYVPLVAQLTGKDTTLKRIRPLMAAVGNPQERIRIVHIAGTSGKTSTAYYMAALLQQAGQRVGLTVSPHIDSVTERVQIDGKPLADSEFCYLLGDFLAVVEQMADRPSYFELLYAFSFYVFDKKRVDYAVIETGMGGLYDATNVAQGPDKVCIITDIGYDHMHILGDTLEKIAAQKAGIIHAHNAAFMYGQAPDIMRSMQKRVQAKAGSKLYVLNEVTERTAVPDFSPTMPRFQQRNWLLAYQVYRYLMQRDGLPELRAGQLTASQEIDIPARMEARYYQGKVLMMDGAHNVQKMTTFLQSFSEQNPGEHPAVLLALKQGKESGGVGQVLAPLAAKVIVTTFNTTQDLPAKSIPADELAQALKREGVKAVTVEPDQHAAFRKLMNEPSRVCIITGSFYLLSQLRSKEGLV